MLQPGLNSLTVDCYWDREVTLLTMMGHMHTNGTSFSVDAYPGETAERIYDLPEWDPDWVYNPQVKAYADGEVVTKPGELFRTTCNWDNVTGEELSFPKEMCVAVGLAYPMESPILCDPK